VTLGDWWSRRSGGLSSSVHPGKPVHGCMLPCREWELDCARQGKFLLVLSRAYKLCLSQFWAVRNRWSCLGRLLDGLLGKRVLNMNRRLRKISRTYMNTYVVNQSRSTGNMSLLSSFTGRHSAQFCALCLGSGLGLGPKDQSVH
jgi:hypothetical protein